MASAQALPPAMEAALGGVKIDGSVAMGVDVVPIDRIRLVLGRTPRFAQRVYTASERAFCEAQATPAFSYATRFAAKVAVCKALSVGFDAVLPDEIEVVVTSKGRPVIKLHGHARAIAQERGVLELPVSLSYTHAEAVACAIAITEESVSAARRRVDQKVELQKRFKQARTMLDELEPKAPEPEQERLPGFGQ